MQSYKCENSACDHCHRPLEDINANYNDNNHFDRKERLVVNDDGKIYNLNRHNDKLYTEPNFDFNKIRDDRFYDKNFKCKCGLGHKSDVDCGIEEDLIKEDLIKEDFKENPTEITESYMLEFLLKKYRIDKIKLIKMLTKQKEIEYKNAIMIDFYNSHRDIEYRHIKDQHRILTLWNKSDFIVSIDELETFLIANFRR